MELRGMWQGQRVKSGLARRIEEAVLVGEFRGFYPEALVCQVLMRPASSNFNDQTQKSAPNNSSFYDKVATCSITLCLYYEGKLEEKK